LTPYQQENQFLVGGREHDLHLWDINRLGESITNDSIVIGLNLK